MRFRQSLWPPEAGDSSKYRKRWVALENCRYGGSHCPIEGTFVDSDEDLAELCARLHDANQSKCIIMYCDGHSIGPGERSQAREGPRSRVFL